MPRQLSITGIRSFDEENGLAQTNQLYAREKREVPSMAAIQQGRNRSGSNRRVEYNRVDGVQRSEQYHQPIWKVQGYFSCMRGASGKMLTEGAQPRSLKLKWEGASTAEALAPLINITNTSALVRYNATAFANTLQASTNHCTREEHFPHTRYSGASCARGRAGRYFDTFRAFPRQRPNPSYEPGLSQPAQSTASAVRDRDPACEIPPKRLGRRVYSEGRCHRTFLNLSISPTFPTLTNTANTIWQHCTHHLQATTTHSTPTTASSPISTPYFRPRLATACTTRLRARTSPSTPLLRRRCHSRATRDRTPSSPPATGRCTRAAWADRPLRPTSAR